jgi:hypothetical protein
MKEFYRLMLGSKSKHAEECFNGNFIGVDFGLKVDLKTDYQKIGEILIKSLFPFI